VEQQSWIEHFGITDPHVAPSEAFLPVWAHYGMTEEDVAAALLRRM
jgi:hypothetical protein